MSNVNNQFKELINEAIHNYFHDKTETEMILKDWLYGICEQLDEYEQHKVATSILVNTLKTKADEYEAKAKAWDRVYEAFEKAKNEHEFSNGVCTIMNEYESGGYDV